MKNSFTIIELIFIIVIIGILAAIAIPKLASVQDDAVVAVEKSTIGEARHSVLSFHGWKILHPDKTSKSVTLIAPDGSTEYECNITFSNFSYPITVTAKEVGTSTDNNYTIGSSTSIGEYRSLAPLMLDPSTIKDWNSTRVDFVYEHLNGPASNLISNQEAYIHIGKYWQYSNKDGRFILK